MAVCLPSAAIGTLSEERSRNVRGSFWERSGIVPGLFEDRSGIVPRIVPESFRDRSRNVVGTCRDRSRNIPGTFKERSRAVYDRWQRCCIQLVVSTANSSSCRARAKHAVLMDSIDDPFSWLID
ncbi:unnamed protein product [Laminaria digitata]